MKVAARQTRRFEPPGSILPAASLSRMLGTLSPWDGPDPAAAPGTAHSNYNP